MKLFSMIIEFYFLFHCVSQFRDVQEIFKTLDEKMKASKFFGVFY